MFSSFRRVVLATVLLAPFFGVSAVGAESADEQTLTKAKVATDGPGLLEFFRKRTLDDATRARLKQFIVELGDDSYDVRENATKQLILFGLAARRWLHEAVHSPDLEVRRRAERCIDTIERDAPERIAISLAAVRVLKLRNPADTVPVLFAYLPSAEDERVAEEARLALIDIVASGGKPDAVLVAGLKDADPVKRATAAMILCRVRPARLVTGQLPAIRALLTDPDPKVRLKVALGLAMLREKESVPVLIALLDVLPAAELGRAEELLCRLAAERTPPFPSDATMASQKKYREAWEAWWKADGAKLDLAHLEETARTLGHTLVVLLDGNKVVELDGSNRPLWEVSDLLKPLDVQRLAGDRFLVAEYGGNRVTERNSKGEIVWEYKISEPLVAQRLPNGDTFIATRGGIEQVDKDKKPVLTYNRPGGENVMRARRLPDGDIVLITALADVAVRYARLDSTSREIKTSFGVEVRTSGGRIDVLPNGNVLIPELNSHRVVELKAPDEPGTPPKEVRVLPFEAPVMVGYLPNGHLLLTSNTQNRAVELDRSGKEVWEYRRESRVTRAVRP
jgi:HEAT repeats